MTAPDPDVLAAADALMDGLGIECADWRNCDTCCLRHDAIAAALQAYGDARASKARREGMEEAAKIADRQAAHDPAVIGNTDERITHRHCAMDIAASIRAANTGGT